MGLEQCLVLLKQRSVLKVCLLEFQAHNYAIQNIRYFARMGLEQYLVLLEQGYVLM
jgi:hypothetical protein